MAKVLWILEFSPAAPRGQNQTRLWRSSICRSSLLSFPSNIHGNTATSQATELVFVLPDRTWAWTGPVTALVPQWNTDWVFRHPVLTIKGLSLICPTIPRAEPCCVALISVVAWTGDISPCFPSAQVPLMLSTRLAHHWQRACLTPGTPGGSWKDTTALQHAQIPGPCSSFAGRTAAWLKMARWYICSPRWNYTQAIGAAGRFYLWKWKWAGCLEASKKELDSLGGGQLRAFARMDFTWLLRCAWSIHTHTQPGRGEPRNDSSWEGNEHHCLSLPSSLPCALFSPLSYIWNKEFGQSKSQKGLYFSACSIRFKRILCWGRVAVLCSKCWNWHLQIKINYMQ